VPVSRPDHLAHVLRHIRVQSGRGSAAVAESAAARPDATRGRVQRVWRWWAARPTLSAAVIYAILSVLFAGQGLLPGRTLSNADMLWSTPPWTASGPPDVRFGGANFELADATAVFQPFFDHAKRVLPDAPLWNAHIMAGRPFLANAQSAIFSPFTSPAYVLPLSKALAVMAILKLFVGAFGTYLLGRALGMRFGGALLAGVVFAFGTFFVAWLAWPLTNVFPLVPWLLLLTEMVVRRPGPLPVAGLATLVALAIFGGHPETTFHTLVATIAFFALRVVLRYSRAGRDRRALISRGMAFGLALAGGTAIAAVMLLPLLELFLHSGDYARRLGQPPGHAEARYLGAFFLFDYWGRPTQTPLVADLVSNRGFYAGGITLMLAAVGLMLRPTITRLAFAAFGGVAIAVVVGVDPIYSAVTALPGFRTAHNGRLVFLVLFALAMLAGWGLDELSRRDPVPLVPRRMALGAAVAIFCVPIAWLLMAGTIAPSKLGPALEVAWGFADAPRVPHGQAPDGDTAAIVQFSALLQWLPLAGAGLGLIALRLARARPRVSPALPAAALVSLAVAVLVADLFRANMGFNPAIPVAHAEQPTTPAIRYLQARTPNRFSVLSRSGIDQPLQPDLSMRYGLYDARGYDYPVERRYDAFWRATVASTGDFIEPTQRSGASQAALRALSLLSVTDLLHYPYGERPRLPGLRLAYSGPDARVYRNENALPRAFLVARQRTVPDADAALAGTIAPDFNARRLALTERPVPGVPQEDGADARSPGTARLVDYKNERAVVAAKARTRSLLVLTDIHFPGWKATVNGRPARIERVDYLLRGVVVPPGAHRVEFRYEPVSWRVGWIISSAALTAVAALALVGWRRRAGPRGAGR
jgi:hypothetical protein